MQYSEVSLRTRLFVVAAMAATLLLSFGSRGEASGASEGPLARPRGAAARAVPWPVVGTGELRHRELPIVGFHERGALRLQGGADLIAPVLHLVALHHAPRLEEHLPEFRDARGVEFYGLAAGIRHGFLSDGGRATPMLRLEVRRGEMVAIETPDLAAQEVRSLQIIGEDGPIERGGSVFVDYGEFHVLMPWDGAPIQLRSPLHKPRGLAVGFAEDGRGTVRLGSSARIMSTTGDLVVPIRRGSTRIRLDRAEVANAPFAIGISAGMRVTANGRQVNTNQILAALLPAEFDVPPRAHTWSKGDLDQALSITGVPEGRVRVGAGFERRGRYVLWREVDADSDGVVVGLVSPPPPEARSVPRGRVLPPWIRTTGLDSWSAAGPCADQPHGPGEVWDVVKFPGGSCRRRVGWSDGSGTVHMARVATIELPRPTATGPVTSVHLQVTVPHAIRGDGVVYDLEAEGGWIDGVPPMPDGLLSSTVQLAEQRAPLQFFGVIENGRLRTESDRWLTVDQAYVDRAELRLLVENATGTPAAGTRVFLENGAQAGMCDSHGRTTLLLEHVRRLPILACLRVDEVGFTHHVFTSGPEVVFRVPGAAGVPLSWSLLEHRLGLSLSDCGFENVTVGCHPMGEACRLARGQTGPAVPADSLLEFAAEADGADLWSWSRGTDMLPSTCEWAQVVLNSRRSAHIVHLTLPAAEVRFRMPAESRRVVRVAAPVTIAVLSITDSGGDKRELLVDEGVTVSLQPSDLLVVEYDK